jgi:hypothetical protein
MPPRYIPKKLKPPSPVGRPSKYIEEYAEQARKLCRLGATDADLADFFKVDLSTIANWQARHLEFFRAVQIPKEAADDLMERSLYMKGRGFFINTEKVFLDKDAMETDKRGNVIKDENGDDPRVVRVRTREYYSPDTAAAFIWLKNRRKDIWRDRHEVDIDQRIDFTKTYTMTIFDDHRRLMAGDNAVDVTPKKVVERVTSHRRKRSA